MMSSAATELNDDTFGLLDLGMDPAQLNDLSREPTTPLRLADLYKYGTGTDRDQRMRNAQFLHRELQIRCAHRAYDLLTLPQGLSDAKPIRQVAAIYLGYIKDLQENLKSPTTQEEEDTFTDYCASLILDQTTVPLAIAEGIQVWSEDHDDIDAERLQQMEDALYRFFTARVGLRFLAIHHALSSTRPSTLHLRKVVSFFNDENDLGSGGCIQHDLNMVKEVRRVVELVKEQTLDYYGICPEIDVLDCINDDSPFTYVPFHVHYMVSELLKNSCRATVQKYLRRQMKGERGELSPIRIVLVKGDEDVTIKVADRGGGIPRSVMSKIWKFSHSTAAESEKESDFGTNDQDTGSRLRGFGLPLARIYARYFGGQLTLKSMEGYGLDAYLHLPRLGDACENLPTRVRKSAGEADSTPRQRVSARQYSTLAHRTLQRS